MNDERAELDALLVRRAVEGLRPDEETRLARLLADHPEVDAEWADRVVGELDAEWDGAAPTVDDVLRARLVATIPGEEASRARLPAPRESRAADWTRWTGWAMAASLAALLLATSGTEPRSPVVGGDVPAGGPASATTMDPNQPGTIVASWAPGNDATGAQVTGQVVWDTSRQTGRMRFRGLAVNAPDEFQYQLWIFDRERDERYPVDGGVFDMPAGVDEAEVAIEAKLPVGRPTLFAVTVERPGGVVVSDRSRIASVAEVLE